MLTHNKKFLTIILLLKIQMQDSKLCKTPMASRTKLFIGDCSPYSKPSQ